MTHVSAQLACLQTAYVHLLLCLAVILQDAPSAPVGRGVNDHVAMG
jgi:hypothetical protein